MFFKKKKKEWFIVAYKHEKNELTAENINLIYIDDLGLNNLIVNDPYIEIIKIEKV